MTVPPPEEPVQPARRGRLQNRLVREVTGYVFLVDLDPRVSPEVLDALELQGIAAYVEPLAGSTGAWMEVRIPARPTDRLQVDSRRLEEARALLRGHHLGLEEPGDAGRPDLADAPQTAASEVEPSPEPPPADADRTTPAASGSPVDEEAAWAAIVAQFGTGPDAPVPPWPVSEDVDPAEARSKRSDEDESARRLRRRTDVPEAQDEDDDDEVVVHAEDEAHYEPPPPPPLPRFSRRTVLCLAGILGGLVLLLFPGALGLARTDGIAGLGVLAVVGGLGALVWGMRDGLPVDEGPDDGAVV